MIKKVIFSTEDIELLASNQCLRLIDAAKLTNKTQAQISYFIKKNFKNTLFDVELNPYQREQLEVCVKEGRTMSLYARQHNIPYAKVIAYCLRNKIKCRGLSGIADFYDEEPAPPPIKRPPAVYSNPQYSEIYK